MAGAVESGVQAQYNKNYFYWKGHTLMRESDYIGAIETLNVLLGVDQNAHEGYFLRGIAKYNLDDLIGAEHDFTLAIEKNPVYTMAYNYRAITRARLGNYDDALKDFREAIELRPDMVGPYYSRGVTLLLSQHFNDAIADFDHFIRFEPKVADAYINRGQAYLQLKDTTRAYEEYDLAIRTNRESPGGYYYRGSLRAQQGMYDDALSDFNKAIECDSTYLPAYFNRAITHSHQERPMDALADLDKVIELDPTNSLSYFNRAIIRSQIGDYNRAMEDYNTVAIYSPNNVLLYYNRAMLHSQLGNIEEAISDYTRAIELYPDFANAYLNRSNLRYLVRDERGAMQDRRTAEAKIADYRSKLSDETFSAFADTSRQFNRLLSFDSKLAGRSIDQVSARSDGIAMLPSFRFTFVNPAPETITANRRAWRISQLDTFVAEVNNPYVKLTIAESDIPADSVMMIDDRLERMILTNNADWLALFERGITQSLMKQYTNSVNSYSAAIEKNPQNPCLYLNRSTTRAEMIDFISSIDTSYQSMSVYNDTAGRLKNSSSRTYNYDESISDLNKAVKLFPEFPYTYYNRGNLLAVSGRYPEAYDDYTKAIELYPDFAEAYFNRGLVQVFMRDTRKGLLDISKAGELGITEAYDILKQYSDMW